MQQTSQGSSAPQRGLPTALEQPSALLDGALQIYRDSISRLETKGDSLEAALNGEREARQKLEIECAEIRGELVAARRNHDRLENDLHVARGARRKAEMDAARHEGELVTTFRLNIILGVILLVLVVMLLYWVFFVMR